MKTKEKEDARSPPPEKVLYDNRIKRKNVLALNEKVAAIREYEKMPVYKRIGRMFHCSPDQIKRIVQQKDSILKAWEQRTRRCQDAKTLEMKVVRVSMLGKAVYDWIRRMMYYKDFMITDGLIQKMALQFKSAMGLQNFFPHPDWCDKFRQTYNINENDSKLLKIGYTQGYSVQIKDVMKDVLSECTPDAVDGSPDDDDDSDDEDDLHYGNDSESDDVESEPRRSSLLDLKPRISNEQRPALTVRPLSQLQPIRQLVALPIQANGGMGMSQKVLVATPIRPAGQLNGTSPMTMTIIPLATIAQPATPNAQSLIAEKSAVPAPLPEIKQEIKEEPLDDIEIKQEYISDDESVRDTVTSFVMDAVAVARATGKEATNSANTGEKDSVDYDNLALSSLRRLMQNQSTVVTETAPMATLTRNSMSVQPSLRLRRRPATPETAPIPAKRMPPLPPLTKAPTSVNHTVTKRKQRPDVPTLPPIETCAEARRYLKLIEDFALVKESFRLIGLVTRVDEVLRELDGDDDVDID